MREGLLRKCAYGLDFSRYSGNLAPDDRETTMEVTMDTMSIAITKVEAEILEHRLTVPDCLSEALELDIDETSESCGRLLEMVKARRLPRTVQGVDAEVLADVINGSTMYALSETAAEEGEISKAMFREICKAGKRMAIEIEGITGISTEFPNY
jgi:hypothetical protein